MQSFPHIAIAAGAVIVSVLAIGALGWPEAGGRPAIKKKAKAEA